MFIQPSIGKYAYALPVQPAGWVTAGANWMLCRPRVGHYQAWTDGLWWGQQLGLTPLVSHWAHLYLAHRTGGIRACAPPKYSKHTASATPLRASPVHSPTLLKKSWSQISKISSIGMTPEPLGKNSYNPMAPGQLQGWPHSSAVSTAFLQKHQHSAPGRSFAAKWALLWSSMQGWKG